MIEFLKLDKEEIQNVITDVAVNRKLEERIVEKDLYVSYVLDFLFTRSELLKNKLLFKGGTSLSKGYGLINRFSEDIDVVFDAKALPYDLKQVFDARSNSSRKAKKEDLEKKSIEFYENRLLPEIKNGLNKEVPDKFNTYRDGENIIVEYPSAFSNTGDYLRPIVKIEMGTKDAWSSSKKVCLSSFIASAYPAQFKNEGKFEVNIASAERTFWEKILILHQESHRDKSHSPMPDRYSRHYYDIYKMCQTSVKQNAVSNIDLLNDVRKYTEVFYGKAWAKIEEAKPGTFSLLPHPDNKKRLEDDYKEMRSMIYEEQPPLKDVFDCIAGLEKELNSL